MEKIIIHDYDLETYEEDVSRMEGLCRSYDRMIIECYIHGEVENYESIFYKEETFDDMPEWCDSF